MTPYIDALVQTSADPVATPPPAATPADAAKAPADAAKAPADAAPTGNATANAKANAAVPVAAPIPLPVHKTNGGPSVKDI